MILINSCFKTTNSNDLFRSQDTTEIRHDAQRSGYKPATQFFKNHTLISYKPGDCKVPIFPATTWFRGC